MNLYILIGTGLEHEEVEPYTKRETAERALFLRVYQSCIDAGFDQYHAEDQGNHAVEDERWTHPDITQIWWLVTSSVMKKRPWDLKTENYPPKSK